MCGCVLFSLACALLFGLMDFNWISMCACVAWLCFTLSSLSLCLLERNMQIATLEARLENVLQSEHVSQQLLVSSDMNFLTKNLDELHGQLEEIAKQREMLTSTIQVCTSFFF